MEKEDYLEFAVMYENLAEKYRSLAESTEKKTDIKAEKNAETKKADKQPITLETISALAKKKAAEGKSAEVKTIITECGVKKLSDVPREFYAEVLKKLEAI